QDRAADRRAGLLERPAGHPRYRAGLRPDQFHRRRRRAALLRIRYRGGRRGEGQVSAVLVDLLSWALIVIGGAFGIIGGIGLLRLPDFFSRIHAASLTDSMCAPCIIAGLMLQAGMTLVAVKLVFLVIFLFLTSPTAAHALAKAAIHGGLDPGAVHGADAERRG